MQDVHIPLFGNTGAGKSNFLNATQLADSGAVLGKLGAKAYRWASTELHLHCQVSSWQSCEGVVHAERRRKEDEGNQKEGLLRTSP